MKGFAKLLKDADELQRLNNCTNKEVADLLVRVSIFYREQNAAEQRNRLLSEAKEKLGELQEYLDEIEKYN